MDAQQREQARRLIVEAYNAGGWSQKRLARGAGVSPNTVMSILKGERRTHDPKIVAVMQALGIEPPDTNADTLDLSGLTPDVSAFLRAARDQLKKMPEDERHERLNKLYPTLLGIKMADSVNDSDISDV